MLYHKVIITGGPKLVKDGAGSRNIWKLSYHLIVNLMVYFVLMI